MSSMDGIYCRTAMETKRPNSADSKTTMPLPPHRKASGQAGEYFVRAIETNDTLTLVDLHLGARRSVEDFRFAPKKNERGGISHPENTPQKEIGEPFRYKSHQFFGLQNHKIVRFFAGKYGAPVKNGRWESFCLGGKFLDFLNRTKITLPEKWMGWKSSPSTQKKINKDEFHIFLTMKKLQNKNWIFVSHFDVNHLL